MTAVRREHVFPVRHEAVGCSIQRVEIAARWSTQLGWPEPSGVQVVVGGAFVSGCPACRSGCCVQMVITHDPLRAMVVHEASLS